MKINCRHGFFLFEERSPGDISRFQNIFDGLPLIVRSGGLFTFEFLSSAPTHAVGGGTYLGAPAAVSFEGEPSEVMRANDLVYNFVTDTVVPIATITAKLDLAEATNYFLSPGLILPGTVRDDGLRVTDYAAWYLFDSGKFKYSEVTCG
jgi:hypothetical protein